MATTTIERVPAPDLGSRTAEGSAIKTILLHVQNDFSLEERLQTGLSLARATGAHLRCLHVTPIEAYVTTDSFGGLFVLDGIMERIDEEEEKLRSDLEARLRAEDVPWDYQQVAANTVTELVRCAALSDIVVTGRQPHLGRGQAWRSGSSETSSWRSGLPSLFRAMARRYFDPFGAAVIAWNGSYEAANAVRNAVGLLKLSSSVRVLRLIDGEQVPPTMLLEYLSRHGIHAELDTWVLEETWCRTCLWIMRTRREPAASSWVAMVTAVLASSCSVASLARYSSDAQLRWW